MHQEQTRCGGVGTAIKAGLLADFVVLDKNPLTTPVDQIRNIKLLETIKEGESIWRRQN